MERVELFIEANGIKDARKVPVLLSVIGGKTYDLLRNLSPTDPKDKTFAQLVELLKGHFEPKPLVIAVLSLPQEESSSRRISGKIHRRAEEVGETL